VIPLKFTAPMRHRR